MAFIWRKSDFFFLRLFESKTIVSSIHICFKRWKCRLSQPRRQRERNLLLRFQVSDMNSTGTVHFSMVFSLSTGHYIVKMWHWLILSLWSDADSPSFSVGFFLACHFPLWCERFKNTGTAYLQERTEQDINCLKIPTQLLQSNNEKSVISIYDRRRNIVLNWGTYDAVQRSEI